MTPIGPTLNKLSLREASSRLAAGTMSSEDLTRDCLMRIGAREDDVGAWTYIDSELALRVLAAVSESDRHTDCGAIARGADTAQSAYDRTNR